MENHEYHAHPSVSASWLKAINRSPLHFWDRYINPNRTDDEPTPAMKLGTLAHCAILEPEEFDKRYIVMPDGIDKRTKEGKQLWADLLATGREPVKRDDWILVANMANAALKYPAMANIMPIAQKELSLFWTDSNTGTECKMRPDIFIAPCDAYPRGLIIDVKTLPDASPETFPRRVWEGDMLIQAGHYSSGHYHIYGCLPDFGWLAVENARPHAVKLYMATSAQIEYGIDECIRLMRIYNTCMAANNWPAYGDEIAELELPVYAQRIVDGDGDEITEIGYVQE